jgi:hypothetical protein
MSDRAALYNSASDIISSPPFSQRTPPTTSTTQQHFLSFDGTDEHDIVYSRLPPIPPTAPVRPFEGANCNLRSKNGARRVRSSSLEGEDPSPCSLLCVLAHEAQFSHNRRCNTNRPPLTQTPQKRGRIPPHRREIFWSSMASDLHPRGSVLPLQSLLQDPTSRRGPTQALRARG